MFKVVIKQTKGFVKQRLDEEGKHQDTFTIRLNAEERIILDKCKKVIEQERDGTTLKQIFKVGASFVLHDQKLHTTLGILFKNKRNNKRLGIVTYE